MAPNAGKDAEKLDHRVARENVKWYNYFSKQLNIFLKKTKKLNIYYNMTQKLHFWTLIPET